MTVARLVAIAAGGTIGFAVAWWWARTVIRRPPATLMRVNVNGREVPAVLGAAVAWGTLCALAAVGVAAWMGWDASETERVGLVLAIVVAMMAAAGAADDRRGDEPSRGFAGHLEALRARNVTGGVVKMAAGGAAAVVTGALLFPADAAGFVAAALLVPLTANTINLMDRAPGRAAKVFLVVALPLMALGDVRWAVAAAGAVGALTACLPFDLGEKAMLGDAGANPLGAVLGVGLAVALDGPWRWVAVVLLVLLNAASERWSFSRAIERTPWLQRLDRIGRK